MKKSVWKVPRESQICVKDHPKNRNQCVQWTLFISVFLMSLGLASLEMWMTPALAFLISDDFKFRISEDEISVLASIFNVGEILGFLTYPLLIDRFGRKYTLIIFAFPQILSCTLIFIAKNIITLYSARIIGGFSLGAMLVTQIIFMNEVADEDNRGLIMSIAWFSSSLGSISSMLLGAFLSYDTMNLIILLIQPAFIIPFLQVPESPYFYLKVNREDEAIESLSKYRKNNDPQSIILQVKRIQESIEEEKGVKLTIRNIIQNKCYRKGFIIITSIKLGTLFSGNGVILVYIQEIFMYTGFSLAPEYSTLIVTTSSIVFVVPILYLADIFGRRYVIIYASIISFISLFYLGLFFFMKNYLQIENLSSIAWTPLLAIIIFIITTDILVSTSMILSGEIFSIQVKGPALSFIYIKTKIVEVLLKLSFSSSIRTFDMYGTFWTYAVVSFLFFMTTLKFLPETKGKSLEEIQLLLN
ncbi:facilitated trehalose transporter Tret1-2 homolog [Leptopilina heterotoma]|uniref:facilitated trehalose transporter Tret1-2 homolog n=1 Tax=Leptopilina heterotoma TaxID=63436 RepID=UPI001CA8AF46|nr:facilitated trehalose transporter Tret1-2 homolog [Leptopilina heterotoma]